MQIYLSLLTALVGCLLYLATDRKAGELGRILFFCGVLAFLLGSAGKALSVIP